MALKIIQGEDTTVIVKVTDKKTKEAHPFDGFEGATAFFPKKDDAENFHAVTGSVLTCGKLQFPVVKGITAEIEPADPMDLEYQWIQNGLLYVEHVDGQISVVPRFFTV